MSEGSVRVKADGDLGLRVETSDGRLLRGAEARDYLIREAASMVLRQPDETAGDSVLREALVREKARYTGLCGASAREFLQLKAAVVLLCVALTIACAGGGLWLRYGVAALCGIVVAWALDGSWIAARLVLRLRREREKARGGIG